jgi:hypothetical protein
MALVFPTAAAVSPAAAAAHNPAHSGTVETGTAHSHERAETSIDLPEVHVVRRRHVEAALARAPSDDSLVTLWMHPTSTGVEQVRVPPPVWAAVWY